MLPDKSSPNQWLAAVAQAKQELGIQGFAAPKKGTALYDRAKDIHKSFKTTTLPNNTPQKKPKKM